ncbi:MAG: ECF-type sigma factor, partial [Gemmatimonadaceae bacterium]
AKRGGGAFAVTLGERVDGRSGAGLEPLDLLAIDMALEQLATVDARKARVVELHYFGGLDQREISAVLGVSVATVERDLKFARGWIYEQLREA